MQPHETPNDILSRLDLPPCLRQRTLERTEGCSIREAEKDGKAHGFILYLPTVILRKRHNPGFALACRLANNYNVPLLVLCSVLDDAHLSQQLIRPKDNDSSGIASISMTARRLAFTMEALQSCCPKWEAHGAAVAIRIHGPHTRTPDHLTLIHRGALAVVTDEAFVEPYRIYMQKVSVACQSAKIPCWSVDGSTTVPPKTKLHLKKRGERGEMWFGKAPQKAWAWEKATDSQRAYHVLGATKDGQLDAPDLNNCMPSDFLQQRPENLDQKFVHSWQKLMARIPSSWKKEVSLEHKDKIQKPLWSVSEIKALKDLKAWSMNDWHGADTSVPPCVQTIGSEEAARQRWMRFLKDGGLKQYAKTRNRIVSPHAVSRISCYLNLGILSIFDVIENVWSAKKNEKGYSTGCQKFLDEVVKWREIGYVWAFASPHFNTDESIPTWAKAFLTTQRQQETLHETASSSSFRYEQLESGTTKDHTWDAMQTYLVETGELHNNARMTWGKSVVHWQSTAFTPSEVLWQLICLNDRFALDGLSPPSYAGLLWCFGWGDKPASGGSVSTKWAHRYRTGPEGFEEAKEKLLDQNVDASPYAYSVSTISPDRPAKKTRIEDFFSRKLS